MITYFSWIGISIFLLTAILYALFNIDYLLSVLLFIIGSAFLLKDTIDFLKSHERKTDYMKYENVGKPESER